MRVEPVQHKLLCDPGWGRIISPTNSRFEFLCYSKSTNPINSSADLFYFIFPSVFNRSTILLSSLGSANTLEEQLITISLSFRLSSSA